MKIYGFEEKDAKRIQQAVRRFEGAYRNLPPGRGKYPVGDGGSSPIPFQLPGGGIAAGSIASPSSATVTLLVPAATGPGMTTTGGSTETMYSMFAAAGGASKNGWGTYINGLFYMVQLDC